MPQKLILFPMFAMFLLCCVVVGTLLARRIAFYKGNRVHPQKTATSLQMAATITDTRAADNFRNLFETPVLFYAAVLMIFSAGLTNLLLVALAWGFVLARYAHSYIQCTRNVVMNRFYAFVTANVFLVTLWGVTGYQLLAQSG